MGTSYCGPSFPWSLRAVGPDRACYGADQVLSGIGIGNCWLGGVGCHLGKCDWFGPDWNELWIHSMEVDQSHMGRILVARALDRPGKHSPRNHSFLRFQ